MLTPSTTYSSRLRVRASATIPCEACIALRSYATPREVLGAPGIDCGSQLHQGSCAHWLRKPATDALLHPPRTESTSTTGERSASEPPEILIARNPCGTRPFFFEAAPIPLFSGGRRPKTMIINTDSGKPAVLVLQCCIRRLGRTILQ